jgi:4'-phosphopantetheinyl transferase EntD
VREPESSILETLFGPDVTSIVASPEDHDVPLKPEEAQCVRGAVEKRVREFAAGRACARRALARLGVHDHPLVIGTDRAPVWPDGITGSITHCPGFVAAAVARRESVDGLGLDAEPLTPLNEEVFRIVCTPSERISVVEGDPLWAKALFCAKEAVFKCLFPVYKVWLDFQDVDVVFNKAAGRFAVRLVGDVSLGGDAGALRGTFARTPARWIMAVTLRL